MLVNLVRDFTAELLATSLEIPHFDVITLEHLDLIIDRSIDQRLRLGLPIELFCLHRFRSFFRVLEQVYSCLELCLVQPLDLERAHGFRYVVFCVFQGRISQCGLDLFLVRTGSRHLIVTVD